MSFRGPRVDRRNAQPVIATEVMIGDLGPGVLISGRLHRSAVRRTRPKPQSRWPETSFWPRPRFDSGSSPPPEGVGDGLFIRPSEPVAQGVDARYFGKSLRPRRVTLDTPPGLRLGARGRGWEDSRHVAERTPRGAACSTRREPPPGGCSQREHLLGVRARAVLSGSVRLLRLQHLCARGTEGPRLHNVGVRGGLPPRGCPRQGRARQRCRFARCRFARCPCWGWPVAYAVRPAPPWSMPPQGACR